MWILPDDGGTVEEHPFEWVVTRDGLEQVVLLRVSHGDLIYTITPKGTRGHFWKLCSIDALLSGAKGHDWIKERYGEEVLRRIHRQAQRVQVARSRVSPGESATAIVSTRDESIITRELRYEDEFGEAESSPKTNLPYR